MVMEEANEDDGKEIGSRSPSPPAPPLPPRPLQRLRSIGNSSTRTAGKDGHLQATPTTAITSVDIQTLSFPDGSRGTFSTDQVQLGGTPSRSVSTSKNLSSGQTTPNLGGFSSPGGKTGTNDDSMSVFSFAPTTKPPADLASLVAGEFNKKSRAWAMLRSQSASVLPFQKATQRASDVLVAFPEDFDDIPETINQGSNDEARLEVWQSKLKHYMILSSAGKPIWSRHGDLGLINGPMAIVQTIISFYNEMKDPLKGFTAGDARFVVSTEGPLYFVAISRLGESDAQLRDQLKALYMQILSTLTLPTLTRIFLNRPSTDLRTPLQGTESLLSSLADSFTRGSPSSLLGAVECLKMRKAHRHTITSAMLKAQADKLLYGLIVAGGKLVSVIRPRRHSLHPSDLQLIFNMLFESGGVKSGGGENWIPICLPAFNNQGYLYMYVSFFESGETVHPQSDGPHPRPSTPKGQEVAIVLVSPDRESFSGLQQMRNKLAVTLANNGSLKVINEAAKLDRCQIQLLAPGLQISHFLYKSRANVQFCMSALEPTGGPSPANKDSENDILVARRRLMTLYHQLHAAVHARHTHLKILHCVSEDAASLAWITPVFELYCVSGPNVSRTVMTQGANKIIQWAKKEEERLFIIGGGVF